MSNSISLSEFKNYLRVILGHPPLNDDSVGRLIRFKENPSANSLVPEAGCDARKQPYHAQIIKLLMAFEPDEIVHLQLWAEEEAERFQDEIERRAKKRAALAEETRLLPPEQYAMLIKERGALSSEQKQTMVQELSTQLGLREFGRFLETLTVKGKGRRIVVFLDGTTNTPEELQQVKNIRFNVANPPPITNVVRLMRGVLTDDDATSKPQIIGYFRGVATEGSSATRLFDAATSRGLSRTVLDAYRFISNNLEWVNQGARLNRDEIYIFGFSRGAFAARALCGFLDRMGLLKKKALWLLPYFFSQYQKNISIGGDFDSRTEALWESNVHPEYRSNPVHFPMKYGSVS